MFAFYPTVSTTPNPPAGPFPYWTEGKPMPTPRTEIAGAAIDNSVYIAGGFVNGTLYAVGGVNGSFGSPSAPVAINEAYDPASDSWSQKAPMPTPRQHLASAAFDDLLYVIGGRIDSLASNLDSNEAYNPANDTWTELAPMPSKRGGLAAAASGTDGGIYVFGGESLTGTFRNTEWYSTGDDIWEQAPAMPNGRHGLAAADIGNRIFVIGGGPQPGLTVGDYNQILNTFYAVL